MASNAVTGIETGIGTGIKVGGLKYRSVVYVPGAPGPPQQIFGNELGQMEKWAEARMHESSNFNTEARIFETVEKPLMRMSKVVRVERGTGKEIVEVRRQVEGQVEGTEGPVTVQKR